MFFHPLGFLIHACSCLKAPLHNFIILRKNVNCDPINNSPSDILCICACVILKSFIDTNNTCRQDLHALHD